jgi:hypothetical protein
MTVNTFYGFVNESGVLTLDFPAQFKAYVKHLKGEEVEVEVRKRRSKRSLKQNASYHALLAVWALSEGHNIEDLKDDCLREVFGLREVVSPITGEVRHVLAEPHTSTLTTEQFARLMDRTVELAAECGVILELPDEFNARKQQERRAEAKRQKQRAA